MNFITKINSEDIVQTSNNELSISTGLLELSGRMTAHISQFLTLQSQTPSQSGTSQTKVVNNNSS